VLVVTFAGILLAIVLHTFTEWIQRTLHLGQHWAYVVVLLLIVGLAAGSAFVFGPRIMNQASQIAKVIPQSLHQEESQINQYDWGRYLTQAAHQAFANLDLAQKLSSWADGLVSIASESIVMLAVGFLAAIDPDLYRNSFLKVVPTNRRSEAAELLHAINYTLQWWFIGQLVPMAVLGMGTFFALWFFHIPLAFILALFTAVMLFIPYAGSVIAYIPAALVTLMRGPVVLLYVTALYLAVHLLEGYVITPLVQRRAVRLPPALIIVIQLLMWTVAGVLGVIIATPLGAACLVIIKMAYLNEPSPADN
jgi:predicted PurR-regulated permease PerM